jgi:hypothetical protein
VQNFYRLLAASEEKVHDGTKLTILQAMTCIMGMKSKYNFSNQCYNDIVKLIIDLIPANHNMPKDLYQSKKIVVGLGMIYEKINICERNSCHQGKLSYPVPRKRERSLHTCAQDVQITSMATI